MVLKSPSRSPKRSLGSADDTCPAPKGDAAHRFRNESFASAAHSRHGPLGTGLKADALLPSRNHRAAISGGGAERPLPMWQRPEIQEVPRWQEVPTAHS